MGNLFQDLKYGLRMLAKNPGFTLVAVLTLGLGIAVNTTVFTAYDAVALLDDAVKAVNGDVSNKDGLRREAEKLIRKAKTTGS